MIVARSWQRRHHRAVELGAVSASAEVAEEVVDEVGRVGVALAAPRQVAGQREVARPVHEREQQGGESLGIAGR